MKTYTVRQLNEEDRTQTLDFLDRHIASSMFLASNIQSVGFSFQAKPYEGIYIGTFEGDVLMGIVGFYWNGNIIHQLPILDQIPDAIEALMSLRQVMAPNLTLQHILGPNKQAQCIVKALNLNVKDGFEYLYELDLDDLIKPPALEHTQCRVAQTKDLAQLYQWRLDYVVEALDSEDNDTTRAQVKESVDRTQNKGHLFVLENAKGELVSMSAFNAMIKGCGQIGGVFTPKSMRAKGFARAVVAGQLLWSRTHLDMKKSILFTDTDNFSAQRAYTAIGFNQIGDYALVTRI